MIQASLSSVVRSATEQIRTNGVDALWLRMTDQEREEFCVFAQEFDLVYKLEVDQRWIEAVDGYKSLAEKYPALSDIAVGRAAHLVAEKINRAIRYYNSGVQALEGKMYNKAMQYFDLALNVDPFMERALYNLGMAHKFNYVADPKLNRMSRHSCIETFKKLLKMNPGHVKAQAQVEQMQKL